MAGIVILGDTPFASSAAQIDDRTYEACQQIELWRATPKEARIAAKVFKLSHLKKGRSLAAKFSEADSPRARKEAFRNAHDWCLLKHAYSSVTLEIPARVEVVDADSAVVTGTTAPGATVKSATQTVTADSNGSFAIEVSPLVDGENRVLLTAEGRHLHATERTVIIVRSDSEGAFKASTGTISYDELIKDPAALKGRRIYSQAKVFQYDSRTGPSALLVSVTIQNPGRFEFWTDNVLLRLVNPTLGSGIDNEDIIEFWGTVEGAYSYETAIGGTNTVPEISVRYMNLIEKRDD